MSTIITLRPGDLIATGTPGGVGAGRAPKLFLEPGQELVTRIEGIGELRNICLREQPPPDLSSSAQQSARQVSAAEF